MESFQSFLPSLRIVAVPRQFLRPPYRSPEHSHAFYEFGVVLTGQCDWWFPGKKRLRLRRGEGLLMAPGQLHCEEKMTEEPTQIGWLDFHESADESLMPIRSIRTNRKIHFGEQLTEVRELLEKMQTEMLSSWSDRQKRISLILAELLLLIRRRDAESPVSDKRIRAPRGAHASALEAAAAYLKNHAHEMIRMEQLARYYSLSLSHFTYLFRKRFDTSPKAYLLQCRLERVQSMMEKGERSVKEMAAAAGCVDSAHFCKWFKAATGVSPLQFARRNYED